ncbi:flagellar motor protein MotA [Vibrio sp. OCN044]|uniref:Flagellar motor protein MotA n=1 Tax=Vibrio tetraodonis subsp. pristinus TaxID=2695891 RepID=A0A6L8LZF8_9VIBR|nr:MotA/TolQ/ExbB proton channel family protein [Vibrio tetraodonis]MYM61511.1 flagellar motor protein MotA [Vibrio tetraodonis subsp. pristinus]
MKSKLMICLLTLSVLPFSVYSNNDIVRKAKVESVSQGQHNQKRESTFQQTEKELKSLKASLIKQRNSIQKHNDELASEFADNEKKLAKLEEKLRLETGSLGEVFGVVRQNAKQLESELNSSVTSADAQNYRDIVQKVAAATELPSMQQLTGLWKALEEQIQASSQLASTQVSFVNGAGEIQKETAIRVGSLGLVSEAGYLKWNAIKGEAQLYSKQPENTPTLSKLSSGPMQDTVLDPTRGMLLEQLAHSPSLMDRVKAGGVVGQVILGLLLIGMIIAFVRGITLSKTRQKIRTQLKSPQVPGDNPLGRVLAVYKKDKCLSVEALELRLLEVVVDEQSQLEKGLSMLKLLAALAPMLGLLGTVIGMIETFQVITQFGNGDPKVMAGGISMALVTTVLGLVAAMPLLLAHNILSSQAELIRNTLEKQGISLVAQQAEKDSVGDEASLERVA